MTNLINIDAPIGALKTQLSKLLLSVDRVGWLTGSTTGRFDVRRTSRMLAGSERVFKARTEVAATTTAVSIIVDLSSSMRDGSNRSDPDFTVSQTRIGVAAQCAYAIATAVERSNCDVEVVGFGGNQYKASAGSSRGMNDMTGQTEAANSGASYGEAKLFEIKPFGTKVGLRRRAFELLYNAANWATPDYHSVRTVTEGMTQHASHRKVVLVLTDGLGDYDQMKAFTTFSSNVYKLPVLGIGIQTDPRKMAWAYDRFVCVSSLKELSEVAIKSLIKQIEGQPLAAVQ